MSTHTRTVIALAATLAAGAAAVTVGCGDERPSVDASARAAVSTRVERGQYLVGVFGCNDCHTPFKMGANGPEPDMTRFLSGHPEQMGALQPPAKAQDPWLWAAAATNTAFAGPWGISYAANLTPDQNTGLGIWTEEMFVRAIRTGRHMGTSRAILPPMPWPALRNASDEDLKSIYAYLRTVAPIANHVPDVQTPAQTSDR
jgi:mono/diheme cytochrome c family protein